MGSNIVGERTSLGVRAHSSTRSAGIFGRDDDDDVVAAAAASRVASHHPPPCCLVGAAAPSSSSHPHPPPNCNRRPPLPSGHRHRDISTAASDRGLIVPVMDVASVSTERNRTWGLTSLLSHEGAQRAPPGCQRDERLEAIHERGEQCSCRDLSGHRRYTSTTSKRRWTASPKICEPPRLGTAPAGTATPADDARSVTQQIRE